MSFPVISVVVRFIITEIAGRPKPVNQKRGSTYFYNTVVDETKEKKDNDWNVYVILMLQKSTKFIKTVFYILLNNHYH